MTEELCRDGYDWSGPYCELPKDHDGDCQVLLTWKRMPRRPWTEAELARIRPFMPMIDRFLKMSPVLGGTSVINRDTE